MIYALIIIVVFIETVIKTAELHFQQIRKKIPSAILTAIGYALSILTVGIFSKSLTAILFIIIILSKAISKYFSVLFIEKISKDDVIIHHFSFYSKKESKVFADSLRKGDFNIRTCDGDYVLNKNNYEKTLKVKILTYSNEERNKMKAFVYDNLSNIAHERQDIKLKKVKNTLEY